MLNEVEYPRDHSRLVSGKNLFLILTILFLLYTNINAQKYGWVDISGNVNSSIPDSLIGLRTLVFINNEGWIASFQAYSSSGEVYHTTDGGQTFEIQQTLFPTESLHMLNSLEGYCGGNSGFIYRTTNGGVNWNYHGTISNTLTGIDFPPQPADTGYACGFNGSIFRITNSGVVMMISNVVSDLADISFPMTDEGWVCGVSNIIRHYIGGNWTADQSYPTGGWSSLYFVPGTTQGWCVGDAGAILHTTDGYIWQPQPNPDTSQNILLGVFFLNVNEGWTVGTNGIILHTTNGGTSWNVEANGLTTNMLVAVFAVDEHSVYVTGEKKTLLKYTEIIGISPIGGIVPEDYTLFQNYPNPFNPRTTIEFDIPKAEFARLIIYDALGREVTALVSEELKAGRYKVDWPAPTGNATNNSSGIYYYQLNAGEYKETKKMILIK